MSKADIEKIKDFGKKLESSGEDYSEVTLRDIFTQAGLSSDLTERAIRDYQRYRESELSSLSILSGNEIRQIGAEALVDKIINLRRGGEIVKEVLKGYLSYLDYKKQIAETYQESKDWGVVFSTSVYSDVNEAQESFVDYVEETYQTKVKDGKHLQKLTGITHLDSWDSKASKYIAPDTEEEAKDNAIKELEETVINSRYTKYFRALEKALQEGAKYKDLLQIKPQNFGLPKTWSGCLGSDQYSSILWALSFSYLINEPASLMLLPDLRSVAQEIEAPYSVLMDAYSLTNKSFNAKDIIKSRRIEKIKKNVRAKLPKIVEKQTEDWRRDRGLDSPKAIKQYGENILLSMDVLSIDILNTILGKKENIMEYTEEFKQFLLTHFKQEIEDFASIIIDAGAGGHEAMELFREKIKNGDNKK